MGWHKRAETHQIGINSNHELQVYRSFHLSIFFLFLGWECFKFFYLPWQRPFDHHRFSRGLFILVKYSNPWDGFCGAFNPLQLIKLVQPINRMLDLKSLTFIFQTCSERGDPKIF